MVSWIPNPLHMMFATRRKKRRKKMGVRKPSQIRSLRHLRFVRSQPCSVWIVDGLCWGPIQACHVRKNTDGGAGVKPSDSHTIPLCAGHHDEQGNAGEKPFERRYGISMREIADALWARSPARVKMEKEGIE